MDNDNLQYAKDRMMELDGLKPYEYDDKEITLRYAYVYAAIAQAESFAKIAEQLDQVNANLKSMIDAYVQVHF